MVSSDHITLIISAENRYAMPISRFYIILFITALLFFSIFVPMGQLPSDTEHAVATAESLVTTGSLAIDPSSTLADLKHGVGGKLYSKFGVGYALLFVPPVAVSDIAGAIIPLDRQLIRQAVVSFSNTFFAALIIVVFFLIFSALGYTRRVSLISVALIATSSLLLPYSKIIHAETPTTLLLLLFILMIARNKNLTFLSGIYLGVLASALVFIKAGNVIFALVIGLFGAWLFFCKRGTV
ncbi:MAG: hypothetical protein MUF22_05545, partial [Chitinispirillaceae bacterium]|nr:hypothetical protein [Chitinispirillaceae bacterium]